MHVYEFARRWALLAAALLAAATGAPDAHAATVTVVNTNGPGVGFNDATPATPVGGNSGTTVGQQRLIAFQNAADQWGAKVNSVVPIRVAAQFSPLPCNASSAVLGSAGPNSAFTDFSGAPRPATLFPSALANALHGSDLDADDDIGAEFNSNIGTPGCLATLGWYYGLDGVVPSGKIDFVSVLLHELAHGLGFLTFIDETTGQKLAGFDDAYMRHLELHGGAPADFPSMSDAQRAAAGIATGNLHWTGTNVRAASGILTAGKVGDHVQMFAPNPVQPGSSISHWDTAASPNLLMEPSYTGPLRSLALELRLFQDLGWSVNLTSVPPNDNFANATTLTGTSGTVSGSNVDATRESGEPPHWGGSSGTRSVWYRWTAPATGQALVNLAGSRFDTVVSVYTGASVAGLTQIASNDNNGGSQQSAVFFHAIAGTTYAIAVDGATAAASGSLTLAWSLDTAQGPAGLFAAVLPYARSVQVGTTATAFGNIVNTTGVTATGCYLQMPASSAAPGQFSFQAATPGNTIDPSYGANQPVTIAAGATRNFVFAIKPQSPFASTEIAVLFDCVDKAPSSSFVGVNTFILAASATTTPDLIAIGDSPSHDGIVRIPGTTGTGLFVSSAVNIGSSGTITATADTGGVSLPIAGVFICQTNPSSGACINPATPASSTTTSIASGQTVTYSIFVPGNGTVPFDPANNRIFLRLREGAVTRGATNVAVRTD